ncbi:hypothetical protein HHI36_018850 [Cryptolaemus montrouzieri]|uniref:Uncharacterized protein n=1 Tax=Cryptolaemus montrouzieri TaxID=559131 RepID=A0ABD2P170_9CUCU
MNKTLLAASARAAPDPTIPTHNPQKKSTSPTVIPAPKRKKEPIWLIYICLGLLSVFSDIFRKLLANTMAIIIPYIATASQNIMETKFFVLILGDLIPAPIMLTPVVHIPIAAPFTDNEIASPLPRALHIYKGESSINHLKLIWSPLPTNT